MIAQFIELPGYRPAFRQPAVGRGIVGREPDKVHVFLRGIRFTLIFRIELPVILPAAGHLKQALEAPVQSAPSHLLSDLPQGPAVRFSRCALRIMLLQMSVLQSVHHILSG